MTIKERKQIKHSLKTNIDNADNWIKMALAEVDQRNADSTSDPLSKELVVKRLKMIRNLILNDTNAFLAEIDNAIEKLS